MRNVKCPICSSAAENIVELSSKFIKSQLSSYYNTRIPSDITINDYKIFRCNKCSLEFSDPLQSGNDLFYKWITNHKGYYPSSRWEWQLVIDKMKTFEESSILEVGCGSGEFIEMVKTNINSKIIGLDTTKESVDVCTKKGLDVYCEAVETFASNNSEQFDFIVAFHLLEHIEAPKEFIKILISLLKPGGKIFLSTPYSPMSFEYNWFDPLNYPPHHLTRWNTMSYNELSEQLELNIKYNMPTSKSLKSRVFATLKLIFYGPQFKSTKKKVILKSILNPVTVIKECVSQLKRDKVNGNVAADVVLVELSR